MTVQRWSRGRGRRRSSSRSRKGSKAEYDARALGYSIYTQGEDWDDLKEMARDAVLCHFDEDGAPRVIRLHLVREEDMAGFSRLPALLRG